MVLGTPQASGAESLSQTGFLWGFLEIKGTGQESCSSQAPPENGTQEPGQLPEKGTLPPLRTPLLWERQALLWVSGS